MRFSRSISSLSASLLLLLTPFNFVFARSISGDRLLVVDEGDLRESFRTYISDLQQRGFQPTYLSPKSPDLDLFSHGERNWDHLILLPPKSKAYGPKLTNQLLVQFLNKDGNILVLQDPKSAPEQLRDLGRELEIGLAPKGDIVVDHFNWLSGVEGNEKSHNVTLVQKPATKLGTKNYFGGGGGGGGDNEQEKYVAFRGTGHTLGNSPLIQPILQASRVAYTCNPAEEVEQSENPWSAGQQLWLASGFQARNNARITFVGSADSFSDEFYSLSGPREAPDGRKVTVDNRGFANDVSSWTFQETGVLKVQAVRHYATEDAGKVSSTAGLSTETHQNPPIYRIKSDVTFEITLSEYSIDHWIPFQVPADDSVQLEFSMLDPYYRLNLAPTSETQNSTTYSVSFTLPDQHGIFAFRTNYKRPYLTYIDQKIQVTLRHFAHDEWTRSYAISASWVWLGGLVATVVAWIAFVALWLYSAPPQSTKAKDKKKQ